MFVVEASIANAKNVKGVRAQIYREAEACMAGYVSIDEAIFYDDDKLFKEVQNAWNFRTVLSQWICSRPLFSFVTPVVEPDLKTVKNIGVLKKLILDDYKAADSESPCQSLEDYAGAALSHTSSSVSLDNPLSKYQSLEKSELLRLGGCKTYKMHLKNQGKHFNFQHLANNENNMLAGTGFFHKFFDGLNTDNTNMPTVAIKSAGLGDEEEVGIGIKRRKVMVDLECRSDCSAITVGSFLKSGSVKIDEVTWRSSVLVTDHKLFGDCLEWKYKRTKKLWNKEDEGLVSN